MKGLILILFCSAAWAAPTPREAFQSGQFDEAIQVTRIHPAADRSAAAQSALGAAEHKKGNLGRAVFYFRRAESLAPRDPDVRFNLAFLRARAKDKIEGRAGWWLPVSEREWWWLACLAVWVASLLAIARKLRPAAVVFAGLSLVCVALASFRAWGETPFGVVTAAESSVRSGPNEKYTLLYTLHPGAEFDRLAKDGDWVQIRLRDGKRGWIPAADAAL